ncbi:MAG: hypothetical protein MUP04_00910 [Anaerolineae bacterium]|nr:hypothetical protein [Anaerolineae bacterium]
MDEVVSKNGEFVAPGVPAYRSALPGEASLVHIWAAQAEVGWVPTTLLDPYRRADRDYELYEFLTSLVGGFFFSALLTWWLMPERTERYILGGVLLGLLVLLVLCAVQFIRLWKEKKKWWEAIEGAKRLKTYTSSETARSIQNEEQ